MAARTLAFVALVAVAINIASAGTTYSGTPKTGTVNVGAAPYTTCGAVSFFTIIAFSHPFFFGRRSNTSRDTPFITMRGTMRGLATRLELHFARDEARGWWERKQ